MSFMIVFFILNSLGAASLKEAFESARLNMETLKRAEARVEQARERKNQARAVVLPIVSAVGNFTRIDPPDTISNGAFTLKKQYSSALRLQQPLLRGGIVGAYQFAQEDIMLAEFQKNANMVNLYQLVIGSYYNLYIAQVDLDNLSELLKFSGDRVKELKSRTIVGKTRRGELVQAETQLLTARTQYQQGEMALKQAEETYMFYTQLAPERLPLLPDIPKSLESVTDYLSKVRTRPDIMVGVQQIKLADKQVSISRGGHFPSLDLVGNYYLERTGIFASSRWDASFVFSVPLFQGGAISSDIRESLERKREAELSNHELVRAAQRDMQILYQNYHILQLQVSVSKDALKKSEEAYRLNLTDYRYGLATNLEVLQSLNVFIETKRSYNNLVAVAFMTYKNLEAQTGVLP